jgi:hypothetical protein
MKNETFQPHLKQEQASKHPVLSSLSRLRPCISPNLESWPLWPWLGLQLLIQGLTSLAPIPTCPSEPFSATPDEAWITVLTTLSDGEFMSVLKLGVLPCSTSTKSDPLRFVTRTKW